MKSTKFWISLIVIVLILSCAGAIAVRLCYGAGEVACIYQDGELLREISLDAVTSPYSFTVTWKNGGENTITVEQGRICVSHADCPDQVCVRTGWICDGTAPIVCLPNHLSIRIQSSSLDASVQ